MLGWAIANKHLPLFSFLAHQDVRKLRSEVFNIPLYHYNNIPLIHLAARTNFLPGFRELLTRSKPRLLDHKDRLAIHHAAGAGSIEVLKYLLNHTPGIDEYINAQDCDGYTPLHLATGNNSIAATVTLLGTRIIKVNTLDKEGRTPLFHAVERSDKAMMQALLEKCAFVNLKDTKGRTPVFDAAELLRFEALELLIHWGADVYIRDNLECQALHVVVSSYLRTGADVDIAAKATPALVQAIEDNNQRVVSCLLQLGADPNGDDNANMLPIITVVKKGVCTILELLFEAGAAINNYDPVTQHTPMSLACYQKSGDVIRVLRIHGAAMEYRLILQVAQLGHLDAVDSLVGDGNFLVGEPHGCTQVTNNPTMACLEAVTLSCLRDLLEVVAALVGKYSLDGKIVVSTLLRHNETLARYIVRGVDMSGYLASQILLAVAAGSRAIEAVNTLLGTIAVPDSRSLNFAISMTH
ncbi:ankyrin repeat-containing domain protein [Aspergillus multicolor]|uniref:ankyrin repeat domain-containing protein n=1 Tax=Aspergillus multicolor TaxID=41759 RepID=UPI003CCE513B